MFLNPNMDRRELISWTLINQALTAVPGQRFAYSNFGYCLLGRVIEKITGLQYDIYVNDAVLKPCGISGMQIAGNTFKDRAAKEVRYFGQGGGDPYAINVQRMDSHGGWIATPSEIATFMTSLNGSSNTKQLLQPDTLKVMTTASAANPRYAKGLMINQKSNWWHSGSLPGTQTIAVRTHSDFCWGAFTNTRSSFIDMGSALDHLVWHMISAVGAWHP